MLKIYKLLDLHSIQLHLGCLSWVVDVIQDKLYTVTAVYLCIVVIECFSYVAISYLIHPMTISIVTYCNLMNNEVLSVEAERTILRSHFLM